MKALKWVTGLGVGTLVLVTVVSYYTGIQLEQQVEPLQAEPLRLDEHSQLRVTGFERGLYCSHWHAELQSGLADSHLVVQLQGVIDHGPLPWSRLQRLALLPVAADVQLQKLDATITTSGRQQALPIDVHGTLTLSYRSSLDAELAFDAEVLPLGVSRLNLDRGHLQFSLNGNQLALSATAHSVTLESDIPQPRLQVQLDTPRLTVSLNFAEPDGKSGELTTSFNTLTVNTGAQNALLLANLQQHATVRIDAESTQASLSASPAVLYLWGQPAGNLDYQLTLSSADRWAATVQLHAPQANLPAAYLNASSDQPVRFFLPKALVTTGIGRSPGLAALGPTIAQQQAAMMYALMAQQLVHSGLGVISQEGLTGSSHSLKE